MELPFREYHLLSLLKSYDQQTLPLDLFISHYFRDNKAIGSKDRSFIAETVYAMIRQKGLLDFLCELPATWEKRFELLNTLPELDLQKMPAHIRCSFPEPLYQLFIGSHGLEKGEELCRVSNLPAPTTVRVNTLKTTREALLSRWEGLFEVSPCQKSETGIVFHKKISFFGLEEFKEGLFEVQDEGSQLLAQLVAAKPGELVIDYCAGSGGKTLAFAPAMENRGQIYLHDIRPHALLEARKRLKRAGIQNAQLINAEDPKLKKLKKKMNWVLVDAPCTGTGTMRRNPDMKWRFDAQTLPRLVGQQRTIFEKGLSYMHPEGRIVYATCSLLNQENQDQVNHFLKTYELELEGEPFISLPAEGSMDGFYSAVMKKKG
jgi:16S rRNA (cytosine967-C5)-methyltransferase